SDRSDAVHHRHRQIEHSHVRLILCRELHRFDSVDGFANDFKIFALEKNSDSLAYNWMVIGKNNRWRHALGVQWNFKPEIRTSIPITPQAHRTAQSLDTFPHFGNADARTPFAKAVGVVESDTVV